MKKEWLVKTLALGVVVLFISVSCSSAIPVDTKTSVIDNQSEKDKLYVDPNIHLTRTNLSILKKSFNYFKNSNFYDAEIGKVMEQIIKMIEFKGSVNSEDVENIFIKNDVTSIDIHVFCYIGGEGNGGASVFPLFFLELLQLIVYSEAIFFGIGGFLSWESEYGSCSFRVGFKTYTCFHNGYAFGYFGSGYTTAEMFPGAYAYLSFYPGFALIAFVKT